MKPKALILFAQGTNRDGDVAEALRLAGAEPEIVPLSVLRAGRRRFTDYQMLILPGGFSYADALGAGKLLAVDLRSYFSEQVEAFVASGKPVLGICNGFQALTKAGILPGTLSPASSPATQTATLTFNACGHFECRWVTLRSISPTCIWTRGLDELIECPVAHGEGNFQSQTPIPASQIALVYARPDGALANGGYPANPNGSSQDIAGLCNPAGNVLGLMPHPENHIYPWQHPLWTRRGHRRSGLSLFENGVRYVNDR
jgi:phosphoribosylformylglycinamidine synthase